MSLAGYIWRHKVIYLCTDNHYCPANVAKGRLNEARLNDTVGHDLPRAVAVACYDAGEPGTKKGRL